MTVTVVLVVAVLVLAAVVSLAVSERARAEHLTAFVTAAALAVLGLLAVLGGAVAGETSLLGRSLLVDLFLVAVLGGGPATATVLWLVDRGSTRPDEMDRAGEVLRGGAWIGIFERSAVFATLVAGWPEGLAVVLALKGLGRYSELRGVPQDSGGPVPTGGVAERFIIGSFASLLWATACAGSYLTLVG